jgi:hypothetical protein
MSIPVLHRELLQTPFATMSDKAIQSRDLTALKRHSASDFLALLYRCHFTIKFLALNRSKFLFELKTQYC